MHSFSQDFDTAVTFPDHTVTLTGNSESDLTLEVTSASGRTIISTTVWFDSIRLADELASMMRDLAFYTNTVEWLPAINEWADGTRKYSTARS